MVVANNDCFEPGYIVVTLLFFGLSDALFQEPLQSRTLSLLKNQQSRTPQLQKKIEEEEEKSDWIGIEEEKKIVL